jgi:hypothetical protein
MVRRFAMPVASGMVNIATFPQTDIMNMQKIRVKKGLDK